MNKRMLMMIGAVVLILVVIGGVVFFVARKSKPEAEAEETSKEESTAAPLLEGVKGHEEMLTSKTLVSERGLKERKEQKLKEYIADPKLPAGVLRGVCFVPFEKSVRLRPLAPVELAGKNAIANPSKGETEYYESRRPLQYVWLQDYDGGRKRYVVYGAVVTVKGIEAGQVHKMDRAGFIVDFRFHEIMANRPLGETVNNNSWRNIGLLPVFDIFQVMNLGLRDCRIVVSHAVSGEVIFDDILKGYNDPKFPGETYGTNLGMVAPEPGQSRPIRKAGIYNVECRRHPWQKSYLIVADHPYVTVTRPATEWGRFSGEFEMRGVPPGKYVVEVWHPEYEPAKKTHEIEIQQDRTTELPIEFKPPPILTQPPLPFPTTSIGSWAMVGPFEVSDEEADKDVSKLDFKATYDGYKKEVSWKAVRGRIDMAATYGETFDQASFVATHIESSKAQKAVLRVMAGNDGRAVNIKVWINGKLSYFSYSTEFGQAGTCIDALVPADLKAGRNTLLIKYIGMKGPYGRWLEAWYLGDGITIKSPAG